MLPHLQMEFSEAALNSRSGSFSPETRKAGWWLWLGSAGHTRPGSGLWNGCKRERQRRQLGVYWSGTERQNGNSGLTSRKPSRGKSIMPTRVSVQPRQRTMKRDQLGILRRGGGSFAYRKSCWQGCISDKSCALGLCVAGGAGHCGELDRLLA